MKYALYFAGGGAIIGAVLTVLFAPGVIAWYFNPPVEMGGFTLHRSHRLGIKPAAVGATVGRHCGGSSRAGHVWSRPAASRQESSTTQQWACGRQRRAVAAG